jgi:hypothetical protein
MRTSWMISRRIAPDSRDRRAGSSVRGPGAVGAWLLAGLVLGLVLLLNGCGTGGGGESATRPSTERSGTRPPPSVTESASVTATAPTRPTPTSAETPPPTRTPTSAQALPPSSTATSSAGTPAAAESQGLGALGWILLVVLVVGLIIAGWMISRSRRTSAWDAQADALEQDTRTTTSTRLPSVLTAETAGQRALLWPPLRAALADLMRRWDLLAEGAPGDQRQRRSLQLRRLLQELLAALDAESEALATGRDWRLLRPRVDEAGRALSAVLAGVPQPEPATAEPWPPAPGG